jgi:hypothetical protein
MDSQNVFEGYGIERDWCADGLNEVEVKYQKVHEHDGRLLKEYIS